MRRCPSVAYCYVILPLGSPPFLPLSPGRSAQITDTCATVWIFCESRGLLMDVTGIVGQVPHPSSHFSATVHTIPGAWRLKAVWLGAIPHRHIHTNLSSSLYWLPSISLFWPDPVEKGKEGKLPFHSVTGLLERQVHWLTRGLFIPPVLLAWFNPPHFLTQSLLEPGALPYG